MISCLGRPHRAALTDCVTHSNLLRLVEKRSLEVSGTETFFNYECSQPFSHTHLILPKCKFSNAITECRFSYALD